MTIGVALIGSGIFIREEHLPAVQATPALSLKAVYSRSLKTAQGLAENLSGIELYSEDSGVGKGYDDLLKRDDVQAVIIGLPILAQPDFIRRALRAGKHVLAEKPIAADVSLATSLISWTKDKSNTSATLSIAENFRFLPSYLTGAKAVSELGRILTFRVRVANMVSGGKYFETSWRKTPEYQGGFLLDGGVHFVAGTRLLLGGGGDKVKSVAAFTAQLQAHLPPVDTLHSVLKTQNGISGTFSVSFGTTDRGAEYFVACEKGTVLVSRGKVTVTRTDQEPEVQEFSDEGSGVKQEVRAWAEALERGTPNEMQSPEEALRDLSILEACLKSGEQDGKTVHVEQ